MAFVFPMLHLTAKAPGFFLVGFFQGYSLSFILFGYRLTYNKQMKIEFTTHGSEPLGFARDHCQQGSFNMTL